MPHWLRTMIDQELESDERVEWAAMPSVKFFTPRAMELFVFGTIWLAFLITFMVNMVNTDVKNNGGTILGVWFLMIGLGLLVSPLWIYRMARNTAYVITDRRAFQVTGGLSSTIESFEPEDFTNIHVTERHDGSGDVFFYRRVRHDPEGYDWAEDAGFAQVKAVREVERRLKELAQQVITRQRNDRGSG